MYKRLDSTIGSLSKRVTINAVERQKGWHDSQIVVVTGWADVIGRPHVLRRGGRNLADGLSVWLALGIAFLVLGGMDLTRRRLVKQVP